MSAHNADRNSERLQRVIEALCSNIEGLTSLHLHDLTHSCNLTADISECRAAGYGIECRYIETLPSGRRVSRYRLVSTPEAAL